MPSSVLVLASLPSLCLLVTTWKTLNVTSCHLHDSNYRVFVPSYQYGPIFQLSQIKHQYS
ncbi:hypothetical protein HMPREF1872_00714 [Amygdalobacter nucleatus]|uniref:Uncharacterized protein n=1 Tax=Amygdalobacter nucleatus TaxID=3029274 RepID=A0A133YDS7_9FIRM|nr:hypothetical protein HMPREF1872_00714 [Amygdalobacter nucleatus]